MIISTDLEKSFLQILLLKTLNKLGLEEHFLKLIEINLQKLTFNIILPGMRLNTSPLRSD